MFTIQQVQNLQWASEAKTAFTCNVKYAEFDEIMPVGVNAYDRYSHIQELWLNGTEGVYGLIADYVKQSDEYPVVVPIGGDSNIPATQGTQTL